MEGEVAAGERSDRVWTIPNILSMLRLAGVPVFLWAILSHHDTLALVLLMLSGISDYLDGKIARSFVLVSRLGAVLDLAVEDYLAANGEGCPCLRAGATPGGASADCCQGAR